MMCINLTFSVDARHPPLPARLLDLFSSSTSTPPSPPRSPSPEVEVGDAYVAPLFQMADFSAPTRTDVVSSYAGHDQARYFVEGHFPTKFFRRNGYAVESLSALGRLDSSRLERVFVDERRTDQFLIR